MARAEGRLHDSWRLPLTVLAVAVASYLGFVGVKAAPVLWALQDSVRNVPRDVVWVDLACQHLERAVAANTSAATHDVAEASTLLTAAAGVDAKWSVLRDDVRAVASSSDAPAFRERIQAVSDGCDSGYPDDKLRPAIPDD